MDQQKPRVVVLGGLGFIFSHVSEYLADCGWEVHVFDNLSTGSHPELIEGFTKKGIAVYKEDVSFASIVPKIARLDPEYIIMAAHISDVDYSIKFPLKTTQANNNATINAFEAARQCKNLKKLLYVSTDEVYGECNHPKEEHEILFPRNPYAATKAFGSLMRITYDNTYPELRDKTCETRFCNVFGGRQDSRKIIPAIKQAIETGKPLMLHNDGQGFRQWIYVMDIPPVVKHLLENGNRVYNITSGYGCTVNGLLDLAEIATGKEVPTRPGKRSGMDMRYEMSGKRMQDDFCWLPLYDPVAALNLVLNGRERL